MLIHLLARHSVLASSEMLCVFFEIRSVGEAIGADIERIHRRMFWQMLFSILVEVLLSVVAVVPSSHDVFTKHHIFDSWMVTFLGYLGLVDSFLIHFLPLDEGGLQLRSLLSSRDGVHELVVASYLLVGLIQLDIRISLTLLDLLGGLLEVEWRLSKVVEGNPVQTRRLWWGTKGRYRENCGLVFGLRIGGGYRIRIFVGGVSVRGSSASLV